MHEERWEKRFEYFERAYLRFNEIADQDLDKLSDLSKEGFVQRFEYTFELAKNFLKDFLKENSIESNGPKNIIREAYKSSYITNGDVWMKALEFRNKTSHVYKKDVLEEVLQFLSEEFYPELRNMYHYFKKELKK